MTDISVTLPGNGGVTVPVLHMGDAERFESVWCLAGVIQLVILFFLSSYSAMPPAGRFLK